MTPAIATGKPRVFCWKEEEGGGVVEGLLLMPGQKDDIYEQNQRGGSDEKTESESAPWICADGRQKVRGKEEFYLAVLSVSCARGTRNCFKC